MKIYVYKEYCDGLAYGEEIIKLYLDHEAAREKLRSQVEEHFDMSLEELAPLWPDDSFTEDYVSFNDGCDNWFWIIDEIEMIERG